MRALGGGIAAIIIFTPISAQAGAWPQPKGTTQIIASYEQNQAGQAFSNNGVTALDHWSQDQVSVYAETGISKRFTISGKVNVKDYRSDLAKFSGLSSAEIGGRWTYHRSSNTVLAVGGSIEGLGQGPRNDFDSSFVRQGTDYEVRAYGGHAFRWHGIDSYVDVQAARRWRQYSPDQWRLDATWGLKPSPKWMLMAQVFAGKTDRASWGRSEWANAQLSAVRNFGRDNALSLQFGVRHTFSGRNVPQVDSVVVGLWRRF